MQNNTKLRQQAILEIIQSGPVYSQDELALRLREQGISSTQATLSRDLKALKISKARLCDGAPLLCDHRADRGRRPEDAGHRRRRPR